MGLSNALVHKKYAWISNMPYSPRSPKKQQQQDRGLNPHFSRKNEDFRYVNVKQPFWMFLKTFQQRKCSIMHV